MILKRANDRYDEIKTAESRLSHMHGPQRDAAAKEIQHKRYSLVCAEIGRNILERAYGHNQQIAILHDVSVPSSDEKIDHLMIDAQTGEIHVISSQHLGSVVAQAAGNHWRADYGRDRYDMEDPRQRLRRQMTQVQNVVGKGSAVLGIALLPPDVRCEQNENRWIFLLRSDRFESFLSDRRGGTHPDRQAKLRPEEVLKIADHFMAPKTEAKASEGDVEYLKTRHGTIRIKQLHNGHYALRNQSNPELIDAVRGLLKGQGWWNPKYHNWVVSPEILEKVRQHFADLDKN